MAACALLLLCGCRKDRDEQSPRVRFIAPQELSTWQLPDTIACIIHVSDDRMVRNLTIGLLNSDGVPVAPPRTIAVEAREATVEQAIAVLDEGLPSGTYILNARASDGTNDGNAFVQIQVTEAPLRLRGVFALPPPGPSPTSVYRLDSTLQVLPPWVISQEVAAASIAPAFEKLYLRGSSSGPVTAVDLSTCMPSWSLPNLQPGMPPFFTGLTVSGAEQIVYVGDGDGTLRGYRGDGGQVFTAFTLPFHRAHHTLEFSDLVLSEQRDLAPPMRRLVAYWRSSGVISNTFELDLDIVAMYRRDAQHALMLGNRNGQGVVQDRHIVSGVALEPRIFPEGPITAACRVEPGTWLLALPNRLVRYTYADNGAVTLLAEEGIGSLAYDPATGAAMATQGSAILVIDPQMGTVTERVELGVPLGTVLPWHNR